MCTGSEEQQSASLRLHGGVVQAAVIDEGELAPGEVHSVIAQIQKSSVAEGAVLDLVDVRVPVLVVEGPSGLAAVDSREECRLRQPQFFDTELALRLLEFDHLQFFWHHRRSVDGGRETERERDRVKRK